MSSFNGLSESHAKELLLTHGYNELPETESRHITEIILEVLREPMFILLLSCGIVYLLLGDYAEGILLLCWILVIIYITIYQHRKTEKSLGKLRQIASPMSTVMRDGKACRIAGRELVPGDIILVHEGERIPADAHLLEAHQLMVDESMLTGESIPVLKEMTPNSCDESSLFGGTLVVSGKGMARVNLTGIHTKMGKIGQALKTIEEGETRLQKETRWLIKRLFLGGILVSLAVAAAFYFTRGDLLQSILHGLSAAMALLPEEFPVVLTIFLTLGAWRLSQIKVLTRKPSAIETLGSATVLCSDKTGTITLNQMQLGALRPADFPTKVVSESQKKEMEKELLQVLFHASAALVIDPMEKAIADAFRNSNLTSDDIGLPIREYLLESKLPAMSRVLQSKEDALAKVFCKGAPETIFTLCQLSPEQVSYHTLHVKQLAADGYRVLGAARALVDANQLPDKQNDFSFSFVGLAGFVDPLREGVTDAVRECAEAGIKVIMITGDFPETALHVAEKAGLAHRGKTITGSMLQNMSADELASEIKNTAVFARIVPEQKLRIIQALKSNGEVVAMTGDGVNDAPALKAADIGISMGIKGTDVAREASSLVLLNDHFASIVEAIKSGRRIFDNLQKAMGYIISIHVPIIGFVLIPAFSPALPVLLLPLHIVFLELIIDPVCSTAFDAEPAEKGLMKRPPRARDEVFFSVQKIFLNFAKGLLMLAAVAAVYFYAVSKGYQASHVKSLAFSTLIYCNVFFSLSSLSKTRLFFHSLSTPNPAAIIISLAAFLFLFLSLRLPAIINLFGFCFLPVTEILLASVPALFLLLLLETLKLPAILHVRNKLN